MTHVRPRRVREPCARPSPAPHRSPSARPIDLLLTDMVMPKMNGAELAEKVRSQQPTARVLFMSGYTEGAAKARPNDPWLIKPFSPDELSQVIRKFV